MTKDRILFHKRVYEEMLWRAVDTADCENALLVLAAYAKFETEHDPNNVVCVPEDKR